jgi:hypothetical protein
MCMEGGFGVWERGIGWTVVCLCVHGSILPIRPGLYVLFPLI